MDKPGYTPGPWSVAQPWNGFSEIRGGNGELVFGLAAGVPGEKQPDEICEANARLIAAAPEMFEALQNILLCPAILDELNGDNETNNAVAKARAALSKALGEGQEDNG
jgi:hypothetical protein